MDIYKQKSRWKLYLVGAGLFVVAISMYYTKFLTDRLAEEELKKAKQLELAYEYTIQTTDPDNAQCDYTFQFQYFYDNSLIPIIVALEDGTLIGKNFGEAQDSNLVFLEKKVAELEAQGFVPKIIPSEHLGDIRIYFEHSKLLSLLKFYPFIQFVLIAAFITFGYLAFSFSRRAEQNRVWAGMAKETAHQMGTPISGLVAWVEHLRSLKEEDEELIEVLNELDKDIDRLNLVADRFSKIGSEPELQPANIYQLLEETRAYMQRRAPRRVAFQFPGPDTPALTTQVNAHLFVWVLENLIRNSLDAMGNEGTISATVHEDEKFIQIDLSDSGHGIPANQLKTVFKPGFSTKKRGWGLGLSLAKRIIEEYHSGRIFVKKSVVGEGTTFTIQLPKR